MMMKSNKEKAAAYEFQYEALFQLFQLRYCEGYCSTFHSYEKDDHSGAFLIENKATRVTARVRWVRICLSEKTKKDLLTCVTICRD